MNPLPGVQVTLINPSVKAPYTGMLPGFVAGHYDREELDIDLVKLARRAGARLIVDRAIGLNTATKRVQLADRPDIVYDTLSIDIGITSQIPNLSAHHPEIVPAKPLGRFADAWSRLLAGVRDRDTLTKITVLGGGVAGVELALAMAFRLRESEAPAVSISVLESDAVALRELNASARRKLLAEMASAGIDLQTESGASNIPPDTHFIVSAAGAAPHPWIAETDLALESGYIQVNEHLRSLNTPDVFATGDCAHLTHAPRPKAGVFAVRQAPVLFRNLRAALSGQRLAKYTPQRSYLKLISLGRKSAVTDKWGIGLAGDWVWRWKDRIDQAFMAQFNEARPMPSPSRPEIMALGVQDVLQNHDNACGACGAKVGQAILTDGLRAAGIESLPEDAAIIETETGFEVFSTDHLRAVNSDPYSLAKVAAIHALGDIWAMGAEPKTVLAHIILPPLAGPKQSAMIAEITAGANHVFKHCGVAIAGGHTSSGAELTIGFSISGFCDRSPITQSGACPGDVLVLTKPIGTGVLLAAEMRQLADGDHVQAALESMCQLQGAAAALLAQKATAMTDVTGFGLVGHLLNMLHASGVAAKLDLPSIPLLPGASALIATGVRSTLSDENTRRCVEFLDAETKTAELLFDPQTCGGMLATIPDSEWPEVRDAFDAVAEPIWRIGHVLAGPVRVQSG